LRRAAESKPRGGSQVENHLGKNAPLVKSGMFEIKRKKKKGATGKGGSVLAICSWQTLNRPVLSRGKRKTDKSPGNDKGQHVAARQ